jgi:trimeric autotransporter adhesin
VNNWKAVTFTPTVKLLRVSPEFLIHGQAANVDVAVIANGGTPAGQIALKTNHQDPAGDLTLGPNGTIKTTTHLLPGGPSFVTADYFGDGTFAHGDSNPVPVFVLPEPSTTKLSFFSLNAQQTETVPFSGGGYGSTVFLRADVAGRSGFGNASGNVFLSDDGKGIPGNPFQLNSEGNTLTPNSINTFSVGTHTIRAFYEGDLSFLPSAAPPTSFVITKGVTSVTLTASPASAAAGASIALTATVNTGSFGNPPTGTVTLSAAGMTLGTVAVSGSNNANTGLASATASITTASLPAGTDAITATHRGDPNYTGAAGVVSVSITVP